MCPLCAGRGTSHVSPYSGLNPETGPVTPIPQTRRAGLAVQGLAQVHPAGTEPLWRLNPWLPVSGTHALKFSLHDHDRGQASAVGAPRKSLA